MKDRVRCLRKSLKMTLNEFGGEIGLRGTTVSEMERGNSSVTERTVRAILNAFPNVSEPWLRDGVGDMFIDSNDAYIDRLVQDLDLHDVAAAALKIYDRLPDDDREAVRRYVQRCVADLARTAQGPESREAEYEALKASIIESIDAEKMEVTAAQASSSINTKEA